MGEHYYVYAIAAPDMRLPEGMPGFGSPLHIVPCGELGAIVSAVPAAELDGITAAASTDDLVRHETVVEAVRASAPALPVRFGTVLPGEQGVRRAVTSQYDTLRNDLRRLGDKIELGVTVLWRHVGEPSAAPTPDLDAGMQSGADTSTKTRRGGLAYLRARQTAYREAESARARAQTLAGELDALLRPNALECRRVICPTERLALRDVYLLERDRLSAFERAFAQAQQRHQEVRLLLSGPWPPYSFVTPPPAEAERFSGTSPTP